MKELRFTLRQSPQQRLDLSPLLPHRLRGLRLAELRRLPLQHGTEKLALAELFEVRGSPHAQCLHFEGGDPCFEQLGARLEEGQIHVQGEVGLEAGREMRGGVIHIHGAAGECAGVGMHSGALHIHGDVGARAGGALPGQSQGMRGGFVHIHGNAGERAGEGMRRGILLIQGRAGGACAAEMRAGTILALGGIGPRAALGMRRGTLLSGRAPPALPATFNACARYEPVFLRLLFRQLAPLLPPGLAPGLVSKASISVHRFIGDLAIGGQGEILFPA